PSSFPTEESKIAFTITLLSGRAALWGTAVWDNKHQCVSSFQAFSDELRKVFDRAASGREAARILAELRQAHRTVTDYSIEFRTLAAECKWNTEAQWDMFLHGLAPHIQNEIYGLDLPTSLDELIDLAICVDARFRAYADGLIPDAEAVDCVCIAGRLDICRSPSVSRRLLAGGFAMEKTSRDATHLPIKILWDSDTYSCEALIDSGAEGNFLDFNLARKLKVPVFVLKDSISVIALSGQSLSPVTHTTGLIRLVTSGNHTENITFLLTNSPSVPVVLGHPWLTLHKPHINWGHDSVLAWSDECHASCLLSACSSVSYSVFHDEHLDLSNVPVEYLDLRGVFSKSRAASLPPHRPYDCAIDLLPGTSPPKGRLYSLSTPEREAMEKYISDSLAAKIIRSSSSPADAGFFLVKKRDGSLRPCIDYRGLNSITVKNTYPLPLMSSAFERLQGASFFTKLDLRNAYHLVRIREGDEWKTAFNTPRRHFEYLVLPFGLSNAPAIFQALVNDMLRDMLDQFIYVYLDDILIFSHSLQEHVQHVRRVLQRLLENGLYVKAEKCVFHAQSVSFLGYIVSTKGVHTDPDNVKAVVDWPIPDSRKDLQRFLGFANFYRRFIRNFSQLASPLTALTSTKTAFRWSNAADVAFTKLKDCFVSAPILIAPDPSRQFVVEVDASEEGVGAVLSQRSSSDDRVHPCVFFSHRLSPAERNYDIGNRELLAIKLALEEWRHWLERSGVPFIVWTDHKNLEYIRSAKKLNFRQARWALFFGRFDFSISYRPGSKNIKPDVLSRMFDHSERSSSPKPILPQRVVISVVAWEIESKVRTASEGVTPLPGCPPGRLFVPESLQYDVIRWGHSSKLACHPGVSRSTFLIRQRFWWPSMARDIRLIVLACSVCAVSKTANRPSTGLLQPLLVPSRPWSHISLDFVTGLLPSQGNTVVLT
ncbi:hypothetical protein M9458_010214, partial [Cirrhinus mrigala]